MPWHVLVNLGEGGSKRKDSWSSFVFKTRSIRHPALDQSKK